MGSSTVETQRRKLREVADAVRACGGTASIEQVRARLGLKNSEGIYYRIRRAARAGLIAIEPARPGRPQTLRLADVPPEREPPVFSPWERRSEWEGVVERALRRHEELTALDVAAFLNLASTDAARQRLRPLVLRGVLDYDADADTYRAATGRERAA